MFTKKGTLKTLSVLSASVFLITGLSSTVPAYAVGNGSVSVSPTTSEYKVDEPLTKGWIIEKLNPGDEVRRKVLVSNSTDEEKTVQLSEEDYYAGNEGGYSYTDKEQLKGVGTWMMLDLNQVTLPSQKSTEVGLTIKVPADAKAGEYSGVVALQEVSKNSSKQAINFVSRVSTRVYITVPGNLQTGVKFDEFKFLTPDPNYTDPAKYKEFLKANYNLSADNIFIALNYTNIGNVFNKIRGNIEVTNPDGKVTTSGFNRDLGYGEGATSVPYFMLDTKWSKPGTYKAKYAFTNNALIASNKDGIKNISPTQVVETEFNITQAMIDQLKTDLAASKKSVNNPADTVANKNSDAVTVKKGETVETSATSDKNDSKSEDKTNNVITGVLAAGVVILIGVVIFLVMKKNKKDDEDKDEKKTVASTMSPTEVAADDYSEPVKAETQKTHKKAVIIEPKKPSKSAKPAKAEDTAKPKKSK